MIGKIVAIEVVLHEHDIIELIERHFDSDDWFAEDFDGASSEIKFDRQLPVFRETQYREKEFDIEDVENLYRSVYLADELYTGDLDRPELCSMSKYQEVDTQSEGLRFAYRMGGALLGAPGEQAADAVTIASLRDALSEAYTENLDHRARFDAQVETIAELREQLETALMEKTTD